MDNKKNVNKQRRDLEMLKKAIENKNKYLDCEYCEIEADLESIFLWKEAEMEEVHAILEEYGLLEEVRNNITLKI